MGSSDRAGDGEALAGERRVRALDAAARDEERLASALGRLARCEAAVAAVAAAAQRLATLSDAGEIVAAVPSLALAVHPRAAVALLEVALDGSVQVLARGGTFEAPRGIEAEASAVVRAAAARAGVRGDPGRPAGRSGRAVLVPVGRPAEGRVLAVEPPASATAAAEPLAILAALVASALERARVTARLHAAEERAGAAPPPADVRVGPERGAAHRASAPVSRYSFDDLVGQAPALLRVLDEARRAASSDLPVLVCGESGTGKELLAQAIHHASPRAAEPFVGINVTAIPHDLLESELFGYEAGSFTGASAGGRAGKFELAGAGTVLLDEIGDMPVDMQPKLLRVLQERLVQRVGGVRDVRVRARIVATSHRDLPEAVSAGHLRLDLFHRLCVIHLHLPPLRERRSDVPLLVEHRLRLHAARTGRRVRVAPEVVEALAAYDWPGNVRELVNLLDGELALLTGEDGALTRVPEVLAEARAARASRGARSAEVLSLSELERRACEETLARFGGNVARAALALGLPKRTLYAKLKRWGLSGRPGPGATGAHAPPRARAPSPRPG